MIDPPRNLRDGDPRHRRNQGRRGQVRPTNPRLWRSGHACPRFDVGGFPPAGPASKLAGAQKEARAMRATLLAAILVLFAAAGARAQVYHGNDTGGIIPWSRADEAMARQNAPPYCMRRDKHPPITRLDRQHRAVSALPALRAPS